jgi:uncharacterized protein (DUF1330 family)
MNTNRKIALAVLLGIVIGIAGVTTIHARQVKAPPAYVIAEVDVMDPATFQKYSEKVPGTLAPFNGHFIIRGGKTTAVEGEAPKRFVVIAFDNVEKAKAWEYSPAYEAIKPIRHSSAKTRVFIAEGVEVTGGLL